MAASLLAIPRTEPLHSIILANASQLDLVIKVIVGTILWYTYGPRIDTWAGTVPVLMKAVLIPVLMNSYTIWQAGSRPSTKLLWF